MARRERGKKDNRGLKIIEMNDGQWTCVFVVIYICASKCLGHVPVTGVSLYSMRHYPLKSSTCAAVADVLLCFECGHDDRELCVGNDHDIWSSVPPL